MVFIVLLTAKRTCGWIKFKDRGGWALKWSGDIWEWMINVWMDQGFNMVLSGCRDATAESAESSVTPQLIRENVPVVFEPSSFCPAVAGMRRITSTNACMRSRPSGGVRQLNDGFGRQHSPH